MNKLERMAIEDLESHVRSILRRSDKENVGRMEHEQLFIQGDAKRALEVINALKENDNTNP